jgi:ATP adenylyltransferase
MDYLWAPWRYKYIANIKNTGRCVFCLTPSGEDDEKNFVLHRGRFNFVILNIYPYTTGHMLVAPYEHVADISQCSIELCSEMMKLVVLCKQSLFEVYKPDGFNFGMNLGRCAGAGVEHHLHMHVVPRWSGDANFMSVVGESRVLPESLENTYMKLKPHFSIS